MEERLDVSTAFVDIDEAATSNNVTVVTKFSDAAGTNPTNPTNSAAITKAATAATTTSSGSFFSSLLAKLPKRNKSELQDNKKKKNSNNNKKKATQKKASKPAPVLRPAKYTKKRDNVLLLEGRLTRKMEGTSKNNGPNEWTVQLVGYNLFSFDNNGHVDQCFDLSGINRITAKDSAPTGSDVIGFALPTHNGAQYYQLAPSKSSEYLKWRLRFKQIEKCPLKVANLKKEEVLFNRFRIWKSVFVRLYENSVVVTRNAKESPVFLDCIPLSSCTAELSTLESEQGVFTVCCRKMESAPSIKWRLRGDCKEEAMLWIEAITDAKDNWNNNT